jgi:hypothetical protein
MPMGARRQVVWIDARCSVEFEFQSSREWALEGERSGVEVAQCG